MEKPDYNQQYLDERERVKRNRKLVFSSIGNSDTIAGFEVRPLTARAYLDLDLVGNDVLGGVPTDTGIKQYIFRNHVRYPLGKVRKFFVEWRIEKLLKEEASEAELVNGIEQHVSDAFTEVAQSPSEGGFHRQTKLGAVDGMTGAIDEVAARHGQSSGDVADYPLCKIFALQKAGRMATIPNYKVLEPKSLRDIKTQHLNQMNDG